MENRVVQDCLQFSSPKKRDAGGVFMKNPDGKLEEYDQQSPKRPGEDEWGTTLHRPFRDTTWGASNQGGRYQLQSKHQELVLHPAQG